jgi:hypothetical protein
VSKKSGNPGVDLRNFDSDMFSFLLPKNLEGVDTTHIYVFASFLEWFLCQHFSVCASVSAITVSTFFRLCIRFSDYCVNIFPSVHPFQTNFLNLIEPCPINPWVAKDWKEFQQKFNLFLSEHMYVGTIYQGCQIFLGAWYQNRKKYQINTKCTKLS